MLSLYWTLYKNDRPYLDYFNWDSAVRDCLLITQNAGYRNWITDRTGHKFGDSENNYFLCRSINICKKYNTTN